MSAPRTPLRMLFSCVGRRVELVNAFVRAAARLRLDLCTFGTDVSRNAPGMSFVDRACPVPAINDASYIPRLLALVRRHRIRLMIPLLDLDLLALAMARPRFEAAGCTVLISSPRTVATCRDKLLAYYHLREAKIDTPATWTLEQAIALRRHRFPYFIKPRSGSASAGLHFVETLDELRKVDHWVTDPIVQEYIPGPEFTLDAYVGFDGRPACVVPRRRLRVRGGEVVQSQVVLDRDVIAAGRRVVGSLAGCVGVITIQCIRRPNGKIAVIEINPRFGGGAPLSIAAGADMPRWILAELTGRRVKIPPTAKRNGLMMIRYDQSIFRMQPPTPEKPLRDPAARRGGGEMA